MKKKFDFSAEMNEAKSIKATPKNEYPEEEKRLLKVNVNTLPHTVSLKRKLWKSATLYTPAVRKYIWTAPI